VPDSFTFDPSRLCGLGDPVPAQQQLQAEDPIHWSPHEG